MRSFVSIRFDDLPLLFVGGVGYALTDCDAQISYISTGGGWRIEAIYVDDGYHKGRSIEVEQHSDLGRLIWSALHRDDQREYIESELLANRRSFAIAAE